MIIGFNVGSNPGRNFMLFPFRLFPKAKKESLCSGSTPQKTEHEKQNLKPLKAKRDVMVVSPRNIA